MRLVYMNGGLGNQIFQYVFFRWLEVETGESCIIDDAAFFGTNVPHNGYELERLFGVRKKRLSRFFPASAWREMIEQREKGVGIAQQILDAGNDIRVIRERCVTNFSFNGEITLVDETPQAVRKVIADDCYYYGYWLGDAFWMDFPKVILTELVFPEIEEAENRTLAQRMSEESHSTAVHIRRGDMVTLGWATSPDWYRAALAKAETIWQPEHYYLFSDDLAWCAEHMEDLGLKDVRDRLVVVDGNRGNRAYVDMQLMSLCAHRLIPRSSFGLAANMFCRRPDKLNMIAW